MPWNPERYSVMKPKIIHTKTFSCANDHPIVWYTFDNKIDSTDKTDKGYVVCEYCYDKFIYEPEEKTHSEEMQDKLEPILCPMHEDFDEPETVADRDDYVNRILKGSG